MWPCHRAQRPMNPRKITAVNKLRLAGDVLALFSAVAAVLFYRSLILRFWQFGVALSMGQPCKRAGMRSMEQFCSPQMSRTQQTHEYLKTQ